MQEPKFRKLSDYGDLMTIKEFKDSCEGTYFIDDDGFGYYVKDNMESDVVANPSDVSRGLVDTRFTHVIWFNR